uniref:Uncharacterized protein n=1 Tax=viral metagenome TaxID=1070528 RepID=A0A6M3IKR8_9ZZZZ
MTPAEQRTERLRAASVPDLVAAALDVLRRTGMSADGLGRVRYTIDCEVRRGCLLDPTCRWCDAHLDDCACDGEPPDSSPALCAECNGSGQSSSGPVGGSCQTCRGMGEVRR